MLAGALVAEACGGPGGQAGTATDGDRASRADRVAETAPTGTPPADTVGVGSWFLDVDWRVLGTEPFWGVDISRDSIVYTRAGEDAVRFLPSEPRRAGDAYVLSSSTDGRELRIEVRSGSCSDGMSDRRYEWKAAVALDGEELGGCAIRDPFPSAIPEEGPIAAAGLASHVEAARRTRSQSGRFERVEGTLGRRRGADGSFVAWFDGDGIVAIDLWVTRPDRPLFETSYFFELSLADGETVLRLVESDSWDEDTQEHTSVLMGFRPDGSVIGGLHSVDGEPVDPPAGLAVAEVEGARDLIAAALRARARQIGGGPSHAAP